MAENIAPVAAVPRQSQKDRRNGTKTKKCALNDTLRVELTRWREEVCRAKYSHTLLAPNAFLDDSTIDLIASRTNVDDRVVLSNLLAKDWYFWPRYGDALLARIQTHSQTIRQPVETPQPPTQTVQSVQKPARNTHEPTKVKGANPVAIDSKPVGESQLWFITYIILIKFPSQILLKFHLADLYGVNEPPRFVKSRDQR